MNIISIKTQLFSFWVYITVYRSVYTIQYYYPPCSPLSSKEAKSIFIAHHYIGYCTVYCHTHHLCSKHQVLPTVYSIVHIPGISTMIGDQEQLVEEHLTPTSHNKNVILVFLYSLPFSPPPHTDAKGNPGEISLVTTLGGHFPICQILKILLGCKSWWGEGGQPSLLSL